MKVDVITASVSPMDLISRAAGTCYGKDDSSHRRVISCYKSGHMSVFEHASVMLQVDGISRACSHQLVRHRLASYSQQSQRYCEIDVSRDNWYVVPPNIEANHFHEFANHMKACAESYKAALNANVKPEDARYLLPEATKTKIIMSANVRELFHFLDMRKSQASQWEIRDLACLIEHKLREYSPQWRDLMDIRGDC